MGSRDFELKDLARNKEEKTVTRTDELRSTHIENASSADVLRFLAIAPLSTLFHTMKN